MTSNHADNLVPEPNLRVGQDYLTNRRGLMSWFFTLDHKRVGVLYLISILAAFFVGGVFAILVRTELITHGQTVMPELDRTWQDTYNQAFTLHGAIMVFMFIIPGIPAALGNFVLPLMLGAKDVAFPKLNLTSWWLYVIGSVFAVSAIAFGGLDTGWTFYTPYATGIAGEGGEYFAMGGVIPITTGAFILGFSSILTGVNFIATIHMMRPPGMSWFRMPLMLWGLYATAIIQILATPVLGITLLLLIAERLLHVGIFDPRFGGDPVLYQHFFWFYSHPAVYIMILPAMGVVSELVSTFSHKHIFGYKFIAYSSLAIALLGFFVWGHHMFTSGQSIVANVIFSLLTFSVSIPSAIKVFNWLATMFKGSIDLKTPMIYAMSFIWVFTIGGLTGIFLGALATDVHLHDSYFVVAHFHYVMVGGTVFAFLGGLHYWWPKMFGRMTSEAAGRIAWAMIFVGFNLTFFFQFVMGTKGMPRRYAEIPDITVWQWGDIPITMLHLHQVSTIGSYVQAVGFVTLAGVLIYSLFRGRKAPANPWGAASLEWTAASPPLAHNFEQTPVMDRDSYDFTGLHYDRELDGWRREQPHAVPRRPWRETTQPADPTGGASGS
jgi:cytochrome c oxidase subunit 1